MFADVVSIVTCAWSPINQELVLTDPVTDPVKTHVKSFCSFLLYTVVSKTHCRRVIDLYWGGRLRMAEFIERNTKGKGIAGGEEGGGNFGFGRGTHDVGEDFREGMDGAVGDDGWRWGKVGVERTWAEEVNTGSATAGVFFGEVGSIAVEVENHVAGVIPDFGVGVGRCVVEERRDLLHGELGWFGLG